jgi:hypothetical protein
MLSVPLAGQIRLRTGQYPNFFYLLYVLCSYAAGGVITHSLTAPTGPLAMVDNLKGRSVPSLLWWDRACALHALSAGYFNRQWISSAWDVPSGTNRASDARHMQGSPTNGRSCPPSSPAFFGLSPHRLDQLCLRGQADEPQHRTRMPSVMGGRAPLFRQLKCRR